MIDDLGGFDAVARAAVERADLEARDLGHDRVGTEHLLLGILGAGDQTAALLEAVGASPAATRHKAAEAVGPIQAAEPLPETLPLTARAARALGRSRRFAHDRQVTEVGVPHLLLGVLDVEGTAGQVLRGLGVDVDRLRSSIDAPAPEVDDAPADVVIPIASCPSCGADVIGELRYDLVEAANDELGALDALVFSCAACGTVLGVTSYGSGVP